MSLILDGTNGLSDVDGTAATPAIQELKAELDSVKATVDLLSTEVATLKGAV